MEKQFVKDWMSTDPVLTGPDTPLLEVQKLFREHNIRRVPIVDSQEHLLGIVSLHDVYEAKPSDATTLSIHEINYLIAKLKISQIMTKDPIMVSPDTTMAEAARIMMERKIGGLPVVEHGKLVGILTETDVFRMVVEALS
jgi:acetoin utilization protein AcuB